MPEKTVKAKKTTPAPEATAKAAAPDAHASPVKQTAPVKPDEYITVDLQTVILPATILISAIIIAVILILGIRNINNTIKTARTDILAAVGSGAGTGTTTTTGATPTTTTGTTAIGTAPYLGDRSKAKVAIVEYSDYECPFCIRHAEKTFSQLITDFVDTGKAIYVYRDSIQIPSHDPIATQEAIAAKCAQKIAGDAAYFDFHDLIFATTPGNGQGKKADLYTIASEIGLDSASFATCLDNEETRAAVQADFTAADATGMTGTPGFVVGKLNADGTVTGEIIRGAYPYDTFKTAIEKYL